MSWREIARMMLVVPTIAPRAGSRWSTSACPRTLRVPPGTPLPAPAGAVEAVLAVEDPAGGWGGLRWACPRTLRVPPGARLPAPAVTVEAVFAFEPPTVVRVMATAIVTAAGMSFFLSFINTPAQYTCARGFSRGLVLPLFVPAEPRCNMLHSTVGNRKSC